MNLPTKLHSRTLRREVLTHSSVYNAFAFHLCIRQYGIRLDAQDLIPRLTFIIRDTNQYRDMELDKVIHGGSLD
jgi:hypothetical protein